MDLMYFFLKLLFFYHFDKAPFPFSAKYISSLSGSFITVEIISLLYSTAIEIAKFGNP